MTTPNLGMTKPTVGADADNWGTELNANLDLIDTRCVKVAFSAYLNSATQSIANNSATKVTLNAEEYDVGGYFDAATNYRFAPGIAGYYQFSWRVEVSASGFFHAALYKNGSLSSGKRGNAVTDAIPVGSALVYLNGTTDYVELEIYQSSSGSANIAGGGAATTYLTGFLAFPA